MILRLVVAVETRAYFTKYINSGVEVVSGNQHEVWVIAQNEEIW